MSITGVFIGRSGGGGTKKRTIIFDDFLSNQELIWMAKAEKPNEAGCFSIAVIGKKIHCLGGLNSSATPSNKHEIYNTKTNEWTTGAILNVNSCYSGAAVVDGKIYYLPGAAAVQSNPGNVIAIYNPESDTWSYGTNMPDRRFAMFVSAVGKKIYCIGGVDYSSQIKDTNYIYDTETDTWSTGAAMPSGRSNVSPVVFNGKLYCIGGYVNGGGGPKDDVYIYDPQTNAWSIGESIPVKRDGAGVAVVEGSAYCIGGRYGSNSGSKTNYAYTRELIYMSVLGPSVMNFNRDVEWNDERKPAGTEFQTEGFGILTFPLPNVSGSIVEEIEQSVTINQL